MFHIGFRFLHPGHRPDIQGGNVLGNKDRRCCDKVRGPGYALRDLVTQTVYLMITVSPASFSFHFRIHHKL